VLSHAKQQKIAEQNRRQDMAREETTRRLQQVNGFLQILFIFCIQNSGSGLI